MVELQSRILPGGNRGPGHRQSRDIGRPFTGHHPGTRHQHP